MSDDLRQRAASWIVDWLAADDEARLKAVGVLIASSDEARQCFLEDHAGLREENAFYRKALNGVEDRRQEWRGRAETAGREAERMRVLFLQRCSAIERVRHVCREAKARKNAPGMWLVAEQVLAALDSQDTDRG